MTVSNDILCRMLSASAAASGITKDTDGKYILPQDAWADNAGITAKDATCFVTGKVNIHACFVADNGKDGVILAIRGTVEDKILDWLNDFDATPIEAPNVPGKVHEGFWHAIDALQNKGALKTVEEMAKKPGEPVRPVYVIGYSKGGGVAPLAAWLLQHDGIVVNNVFLFEPPRVGNPDFGTAFDAKFPDTIRSEYQDDIVPHLPPVEETFTAVETALKLMGMTKLAKIMEKCLPWDYQAVGTLRYIDWSDDVVNGDSTWLGLERLGMLLKAIVTDRMKLIQDHLPCCEKENGSGTDKYTGCATQICSQTLCGDAAPPEGYECKEKA